MQIQPAFYLDKKGYYPKIHPTQKPVCILKQLIEIFTDEGDVVIDPVAGSGTTLRACMELNRNSFGFVVVFVWFEELFKFNRLLNFKRYFRWIQINTQNYKDIYPELPYLTDEDFSIISPNKS